MNEFEEIHFWEFPLEINIQFDEEFRKHFFSLVVECFGCSRIAGDFLNNYSKRLGRPRTSYASGIRVFKTKVTRNRHFPAWAIAALCHQLDLDINDVEKHVVSYRVRKGVIMRAHLPLSVNPCFVAIVAHLMGDGSDKITSDGAARYTQVNLLGLRRFEEKLEYAFGIPDRSLFGSDGRTVFVPKSILLLMKKHFAGVKFGTYESFVPDAIKLGGERCRISFLSAFLVDEGALYESISTRMKNRRLVEEVLQLAISLGYTCSRLKYFKDHTGGVVYGFDIRMSSAQKLLDDVVRLSKEFSPCDLAQKQAQLEYIASLSREPIKGIDGKTKSRLASSLNEKPKTAMELARETHKCRRTIRNHLSDLQSKHNVFFAGFKGRAKLWAVKPLEIPQRQNCVGCTSDSSIG